MKTNIYVKVIMVWRVYWNKLSEYLFFMCVIRNVFRAEMPSYVPVMQESPRVGVHWSIISLNGLTYKDAGEYRCQARNMAGISEALIKLNVVGVKRLSRPPKKKSQKSQLKLASRYRKPKQTPASIDMKVNWIQIT